MPIVVGRKAPAFSLPDQDGATVRLDDLAGAPAVIYFYPRDSTPGCTLEAKGFTALAKDFAALGVQVLGISPDTPSSHCRFIEKQELSLRLLSDPDRGMLESYGAWGEKVLYGRKRLGVIRSTVLLGPDGKVLRHWATVKKAADHPAEVLAAAKEILA